MLRSVLVFTKRLCLVHLHMIAGLFLLVVVFIVVALWKFSQGPIDITFAADYVRNSFQSKDYPVELNFDSVIISWPDLKGAPNIDLANLTVAENGREKMHIGEVSLQLAILPLLIGQLEPEAIILRNPVIRIVREKDGTFRTLLSGAQDEVEEQTESAQPPLTAKQVGEALFLNGALPDSNLHLLSSLKVVTITNAKLVTRDRVVGKTWAVPNISLYLNRTEENVDLSVAYTSPGQEEETRMGARILRVSEKGSDEFQYSADLRNVDLTFFMDNVTSLEKISEKPMLMSGVIDGSLDSEWKLAKADVALRSPGGEFRINSGIKDLFVYKNLMVNAAFDEAAQRFSVKDTSLELNGTTLNLSAEREKRDDGKFILPLRVTLPQLTLEQIASLWPEDQRDTLAAQWLTRDLSLATLSNIVVTANLPMHDLASISVNDFAASFDFENLKADYRAPLIPATEAKGSATIKDDTLDIQINSGKIADLNVSSGRITITHLAGPDAVGIATIDLKMNGALATVFNYISLEPISLGDSLGMDTKNVTGQGTYDVNISFPALADLPADEVKVKVNADLQNIRLPKIVHGLDISGGPFNLKVDGGAFTLSGKGFLDKAPIDLVYSEYIDPATAPYATDITAKLTTNKDLRDAFGINLDDFISGDVPVEIAYKEPKPGDVTVAVKADLTPARAFVEPLYFVKQPGSPGSATCVAVLKGGEIQQIRDLDIRMGRDQALGGQLNFGMVGKERDVKSGSFTTLSLGTDNLFGMTFTQPAPNTLDFVIKGEKLDARSFLSSNKNRDDEKSAEPSPAVSVSAQAKTMRTGSEPNQVVQNPVIKARVSSGGHIDNLDITASISDSAFKLMMNPNQAGVMKLKITAADAGKALYAFDLYDTMAGGTLNVEGTQISGGKSNDLKGTATISNFAIVKAPALAKLINGMSLSGFDELLNNKGIAFSKLRTDFSWKETPEGRVINLSNGRTSGASIGLTFGGVVNQTKGTMDISGTLVPMSEINKFVSSIPLIGQLLTGGKNGGIIAATYAMKGDSDNPRVFINPLSVLAPGFLRSILFEGGFDIDGDDEMEIKPTAPAKKGRGSYN